MTVCVTVLTLVQLVVWPLSYHILTTKLYSSLLGVASGSVDMQTQIDSGEWTGWHHRLQ